MNYFVEQLPNKRWGIYLEGKLLASMGCHQSALKIMAFLQKNQSQLKFSRKRSLVTSRAKVETIAA